MTLFRIKRDQKPKFSHWGLVQTFLHLFMYFVWAEGMYVGEVYHSVLVEISSALRVCSGIELRCQAKALLPAKPSHRPWGGVSGWKVN